MTDIYMLKVPQKSSLIGLNWIHPSCLGDVQNLCDSFPCVSSTKRDYRQIIPGLAWWRDNPPLGV